MPRYFHRSSSLAVSGIDPDKRYRISVSFLENIFSNRVEDKMQRLVPTFLSSLSWELKFSIELHFFFLSLRKRVLIVISEVFSNNVIRFGDFISEFVAVWLLISNRQFWYWFRYWNEEIEKGGRLSLIDFEIVDRFRHFFFICINSNRRITKEKTNVSKEAKFSQVSPEIPNCTFLTSKKAARYFSNQRSLQANEKKIWYSHFHDSNRTFV